MKSLIALAQISTVLGSVRQNVQKHVEYARRARDGGASMVIFPELSLTGYSIKDSNWDVAIHAGEPSELDPLVKESADISIIAGGVEESAEYGIYNAAFLIEGGTVRSVHRKVYLPAYGMFEESRYFSPGKSVRACDTSIGRMGVLICEDMWHLPLPYILAKDGAEVIVGIIASPTRLSGDQPFELAHINYEHHQAYARLLSSYVVFCNRVGFEDGVSFWGGSAVVNPAGNVIVRGRQFEEDLIFAEVDSNEVRRARRLSRHFIDDESRIVINELERINRAGT
jgi:NAD+ synthase (glutamine-hydrolysing)